MIFTIPKNLRQDAKSCLFFCLTKSEKLKNMSAPNVRTTIFKKNSKRL